MRPGDSNDHVCGNVISWVAYSVLGQELPVEPKMEMQEAQSWEQGWVEYKEKAGMLARRVTGNWT